MTLLQPAYRLRMYAPRSVDPTEATVLVPTGGAPHSDPFQVASIAGVSGYKPYLMDAPMGRRGRIDLLTRKLDTGTLSFTLIDKTLTAGDNLTRWWNAFWGDASGKPAGRLRVEVDESLDGGATWPIFATMELAKTHLSQKNEIVLNLQDRVSTLAMKVFVGQPYAGLTYIAQPTLCPLGFRGADYGTLKATTALPGTIGTLQINATNYTPTDECFASVAIASNSAQLGRQLLLTKNLLQALAPNMLVEVQSLPIRSLGAIPNYGGTARCHLKRLDNSNEGDFRVGTLFVAKDSLAGSATHFRIVGFMLHALASGDVGYLAVPPAATAVQIHLYVDGPAADTQPILIGDVDPATYVQDLCAGKYGYLYRAPEILPSGKGYGDPVRAVGVNTSAATPGCVSDLVGTRAPMRMPATEVSDALKEIERICLENYWAPYLDKQGRVNIVDLRLPSSLAGVGTITDTDVDEEQDCDWEHDPTQAILRLEITTYSETINTPTDLWMNPDPYPTAGVTALLTQLAHKLETLYIGSIDYGDKSYQIDAKGSRSMEGELLQNKARSVYLDDELTALGNQMQRPFGYGLTTIPIRCRRTATVTALTQGALVICNASVVPDPATHKRGGSRVCRVLEISEDGPNITLRLADIGVNLFASTPTIGAPAQETNNTYTGVTVSVTLNGSNQPAEVRYAVTDTAVGSAPADTSPLWTIAGYKTTAVVILGRRRLASGSTFPIRGVPPGKRIWVQGRSMPTPSDAQMPSAWVLAGGTGYVDTAALPTPGGLGESHTDKTAQLTWTAGPTDLWVEILLATPTSDPRRRVALLEPGSALFDFTGLDPSTGYRSEVRFTIGDYAGTGTTKDITTAGSGSTAPNLVRFQVYAGT